MLMLDLDTVIRSSLEGTEKRLMTFLTSLPSQPCDNYHAAVCLGSDQELKSEG